MLNDNHDQTQKTRLHKQKKKNLVWQKNLDYQKDVSLYHIDTNFFFAALDIHYLTQENSSFL